MRTTLLGAVTAVRLLVGGRGMEVRYIFNLGVNVTSFLFSAGNARFSGKINFLRAKWRSLEGK